MNHETIKPLVFISAATIKHNDAQNRVRTKDLRTMITDLGLRYKQVEGCWKTRKEISFAVHCPDHDTLNKLGAIASHYEQDAILYRDSDQRAYLITDGGSETLGRMVQVGRYEAMKEDAWTFDPSTGKYYIVKYGA